MFSYYEYYEKLRKGMQRAEKEASIVVLVLITHDDHSQILHPAFYIQEIDLDYQIWRAGFAIV